MKTIEVVAAIIRDGNKIFATQRGYGEFKGGWEFPGGKIEKGEAPRQALVREIREELNCTIQVDVFLKTIEVDYPEFHLIMHCYLCSFVSDTFTLKEHEAARWLSAETLEEPDWLPADRMLLPAIRDAVY